MTTPLSIEWFYPAEEGNTCKQTDDSVFRLYSRVRSIQDSSEWSFEIVFRDTMMDPREREGHYHLDIDGLSIVERLEALQQTNPPNHHNRMTQRDVRQCRRCLRTGDLESLLQEQWLEVALHQALR